MLDPDPLDVYEAISRSLSVYGYIALGSLAVLAVKAGYYCFTQL